jgi:hypothetical protein
MSIVRQPTRSRHSLLLTVSALLLPVLGATTYGLIHFTSALGTTAQGALTRDPRLLLHPHTLSQGGSLSNGQRFSARVFPGIPGPNTLRVQIHPAAPGQVRRVTAVATMLRMRMSPGRSDLVPSDGGYVGTIDLAMFGRYVLQIRVETPTISSHGNATLSLALPVR